MLGGCLHIPHPLILLSMGYIWSGILACICCEDPVSTLVCCGWYCGCIRSAF